MFQVVQIIYWMGLSAWFGGVLFLAVAWPVVVRILRDRDPILPEVLSVNLQGQHGLVLAGEIVGGLQAILMRIEIGCAALVAVGLAGQWFISDREGAQLAAIVLRTMLYAGAVLFLIYDSAAVWPRIRENRKEFLEHADEPEVANGARKQIEHYQRQSVNAMTILFLMLLGLILFSGGIAPAARVIVAGGGS